MRSRYSLFSLFIIFLFFTITVPLASSIPDMPTRYVVDDAGIIHDDIEMRLNGYLQELEQKTTAQVIVLTVKTLDGQSLEQFSIETAERWKIGQKGKDNGALIVIALKERRYRFEIGYGLEGILPDSLVGSIGRAYIVPYFKRGEYSNGIFAAVLAVIHEIARDAGVKITGMPALKRNYYRGRRGGGIFSTIFSLLFFIILFLFFLRNPSAFLWFMLFSSMGGGRRGWGDSSSGFGGGGFGGFGGGGGGSFGGGGASGGW